MAKTSNSTAGWRNSTRGFGRQSANATQGQLELDVLPVGEPSTTTTTSSLPVVRKAFGFSRPAAAATPSVAVAPGIPVSEPSPPAPSSESGKDPGHPSVPLSKLLEGVTAAVAQAYHAGVWTTVDVISASTRNGHVYLELAERDSSGAVVAKANGMIWASAARKLVPAFEAATGARLTGGIKLLVRAKPVFKAQFGFSLEIDAIDSGFTLGDLEARKREIRTRLQAEGVFDRQKQLPAPWDFNAVLVVAPDLAAGLGDFRAEADRLARHGVCEFVYVHARFQGDGAAADIVQAMREGARQWRRERPGLPDAIVIIRGGGAANDLAWLNDYALARLICEMPVPVITGIGHERDSTLLDEVAHKSFDTPSKVIAGIEQLIVHRTREAAEAYEWISKASLLSAQRTRATVQQLHAGVHADAERLVTLARVRTDEVMNAARTGAIMALTHAKDHSKANFDFVLERGMSHVLRVRVQLDASMETLRQGALSVIHEAKGRTKGLIREILGQGPEKTLKRGFAVVRDEQGKTLTRAGAFNQGDTVTLQFNDGTVQATVQQAHPQPPIPGDSE